MGVTVVRVEASEGTMVVAVLAPDGIDDVNEAITRAGIENPVVTSRRFSQLPGVIGTNDLPRSDRLHDARPVQTSPRLFHVAARYFVDLLVPVRRFCERGANVRTELHGVYGPSRRQAQG